MEVLGVSSGKRRRHWSMIQETLKVPRITLLGDEFPEVLQVGTTKTWITPYKCYHTDGLLPTEPREAKIVKRNAGRYTLIYGNLFHHSCTHPILTCVSGDHCTRIMVELYEGIYDSHIGGRALSLKVIRAWYYIG